MTDLAEKGVCGCDFVDSAYFEPFYLKEFIATIPEQSDLRILQLASLIL